MLQLIWEQRWWTTRERRRAPASRRRPEVPEKEQYLKRGRGSMAAAVEAAPPSPAPPLNSTEAERDREPVTRSVHGPGNSFLEWAVT
jgi:hypothetical protein